MTKKNIEYKVRELIAEGLEMSVDEIKGSHNLVTDLNADSTDRTCMLIRLEDELGYYIDDEDAAKWKTVADIVEYYKLREANKGRMTREEAEEKLREKLSGKIDKPHKILYNSGFFEVHIFEVSPQDEDHYFDLVFSIGYPLFIGQAFNIQPLTFKGAMK
jgi:acyl carrier protein